MGLLVRPRPQVTHLRVLSAQARPPMKWSALLQVERLRPPRRLQRVPTRDAGGNKAHCGSSWDMALAVCLLLDKPADTAVRRLPGRLETAGIPPGDAYARPARPARGLRLAAQLRPPPRRGGPHRPPARGPADPAPGRTGHLPAKVAAGWAQRSPLAGRRPSNGGRRGLRHGRRSAHYIPGARLPHVTLAPRLHLTDLVTVASVVTTYCPSPLTSPGQLSSTPAPATSTRSPTWSEQRARGFHHARQYVPQGT
jgi:hypothetical protein